jgi:hypothetical protein
VLHTSADSISNQCCMRTNKFIILNVHVHAHKKHQKKSFPNNQNHNVLRILCFTTGKMTHSKKLAIEEVNIFCIWER